MTFHTQLSHLTSAACFCMLCACSRADSTSVN
jgi:hypothetical protein